MALKQTIQENLKHSLREHNDIAVQTLRMLLAALTNKEIEKRTKASKESPGAAEKELQEKSVLSDEEVQQVVMNEAKKRRESIEMFQKGNRQDLVDKETKELAVLQGYLPKQLSEDEIRLLAKEAIAKTGASGAKDIGRVMAALIPQVKGKTDGARLSKIVQELLAG